MGVASRRAAAKARGRRANRRLCLWPSGRPFFRASSCALCHRRLPFFLGGHRALAKGSFPAEGGAGNKRRPSRIARSMGTSPLSSTIATGPCSAGSPSLASPVKLPKGAEATRIAPRDNHGSEVLGPLVSRQCAQLIARHILQVIPRVELFFCALPLQT